MSQELLDRLPRLSDWYNINDDFWPEPERNNKLDWPATMRGFGTSQKGQGEDVIDEVAVCVLKVGVAEPQPASEPPCSQKAARAAATATPRRDRNAAQVHLWPAQMADATH